MLAPCGVRYELSACEDTEEEYGEGDTDEPGDVSCSEMLLFSIKP